MLCRKSKDPGAKPNDHIYDELDMYTVNTTKSPKSVSTDSNNVIFDAEEIGPPAYQPLPSPRYEICSTNSIAKSNHSNDYYIEEDTRSIKDADIRFGLEKATEQHEEASKQHETYCKLYHFK